MKLAPGVRLGPYEIVAPIGAGGMGEVYRATDTRLGRTVAVKVLPAELANDAKLRIRFEREAKAISALSHPNICTLHDVGRENGIDYLVMELCEGETLAQRLLRGPMPIAQVVEYGIQMADALEKAHRKGIIHRDLKPSNIIVTKGGVKLLDFGLAKQQEVISSDGGSRAATAELPNTESTTIVGTLQYMAPETIATGHVDSRSDVYALGLVLYEMMAGHHAFSAPTRSTLIAAILDDDPKPMSAEAPPALDRLIRTCLRKDADERLQSAHDVRVQLEWLRETDDAESEGRRPSLRLWFWIGIATIAVAIALMIGGSAIWRPAVVEAPLRRFSVMLPPNATVWRGGLDSFDVSPDGRLLAYVATQEERTGIYVRSLESDETTYVPGTDDALSPFFSPDGRWIGFLSRSVHLKKVSTAGGAPVILASIGPNANSIRGASWSADGTIVLSHDGQLLRVPAEGGAPQLLLRRTAGHGIGRMWPSVLPDGEHILYTDYDSTWKPELHNIAVLSLKTGRSTTILRGGTRGRFLQPGYLVFAVSDTLFAVRFDLDRLRVVGSPIPLTRGISGSYITSHAEFTVTGDGVLVYMPRPPRRETEFVRVTRDGALSTITRVTGVPDLASALGTNDLAVSADGRRILTTLEDERGGFDVWLYDVSADSWTRLTFDQGSNWALFSPDEKEVVFSSSADRWRNLFIMPLNGSAPARPLVATRPGWGVAGSWTPNGRTLLMREWGPGSGVDIFAVSPDGIVTPVRTSVANETWPVLAPGGEWMAYQSDESGRFEIYVQTYPRADVRWQVSTEGAVEAQWSRDGRILCFRSGARIVAVDMETSADFRPGKPRPLFTGAVDLDSTPIQVADGSYVAIRRQEPWRRGEFRIMTGLPGELKRLFAQQ